MNRSPTVAWYSSRIRKRKVRSLEEERRLVREAQEGSSEALQELIEDKLLFVMKIAADYRHTGVPFEDLLAEANVGLMQAVRHYDSGKGYRFLTYAVYWIRKAILGSLNKHGRLVNVSSYHQRRVREIRDAERRLKSKLGRAPSNAEIGTEAFGRRGKKQADRLLRFEHVEFSLDGHPRDRDDFRWSDRLADLALTSQEDAAIHREERALLLGLVHDLPLQERQVIVHRFGLRGDSPLTLSEIGKLMGLSRERIRQVECRGKDRLRKWFLRHRGGTRLPREAGPREKLGNPAYRGRSTLMGAASGKRSKI